jgi:hypothetical protein
MYEMAKKGREAMKSKARQLAGEKNQKVDSSDWTPAEPMNTEAKTGMRPISRRAFKSGGKVSGEACEPRSDRAPRKSGGKAEYPVVDRYINRDLKKANDLRDGVKHVGGMKKGGRAGKEEGGFIGGIKGLLKKIGGPSQAEKMQEGLKDVGKGQPTDYSTTDQNAMAEKANEAARKSGGRTKKMDGGSMVKNRFLNTPSGQVIPGADAMKKGGKVKFEGSAKDEAQDKKLAKKHGMSMKDWEDSKSDTKHDKQKSMEGLKHGGKAKKAVGGVLAGPADDLAKSGLGGILPMAISAMNKKSGGRAARATGGKVKGKGKTNINIVIQAGQKPAAPDMGMAPPPMPGGIPMPAPGPQAGGAPPPMPMPMPAPAAPPMGGGMPMPRKTGGRVAKSYKDMTAGAGSGKGRLQKADIERSQRVRGA